MSIETNIQAGGLAVTGADPMPWWLWAIAGALVVLGIAFLLSRRRGSDDGDGMAAPIIATVDPSNGQGIGTTTPIPVGVTDEEALDQVFKPAAPTPEAPEDADADADAPEVSLAPEEEDGPDGVADPDAQK